MNHNVLFVSEKWVDSNPNLGFSPTFQNYLYPFCRYGRSHLNTLYIDEAKLVYGTHINDFLINFCVSNKIKVIFFSLIGNSDLNPSKATFLKLKELGIFLGFIWHDTCPGWAEDTLIDLKDVGNIHISVDGSFYLNQHTKIENLFITPAPQNEAIFFARDKDIDISFMGSQRVEYRRVYLEILSKALPNMVIGGGQRETKLPIEKYSEIIGRSKIGINFSTHSLKIPQVKGRVTETLSCETMLLEQKNPCTEIYFTPGVDYVEFTDLGDLVDKANYYLKNDDERKKIAKHGHETYNRKYSTMVFWEKMYNEIDKFLK